MSEFDNRTKYVILGSLFVTAPIIFIIDVVTLYKALTGDFDLRSLSIKGKLGLALFFVFAPLFFFFCYKTAKRNGWIGKAR